MDLYDWAHILLDLPICPFFLMAEMILAQVMYVIWVGLFPSFINEFWFTKKKKKRRERKREREREREREFEISFKLSLLTFMYSFSFSHLFLLFSKFFKVQVYFSTLSVKYFQQKTR